MSSLPDGFAVTYGLRRYEIRGLEKGARKLRVTVRVEHAGKLHVDTLDLYSARARRVLCQDVARIFEQPAETVEADLTKLMVTCEGYEPEAVKRAESATGPADRMTAKERKEAEEFGKSPELVERILADFETCGLIGEENNKLLGYLAVTSRKMDEPLSVLILSSSGAGKTALQDAALGFCPEEDLVKLTNLSGKALFYKEKTSLKHKVLAIEEGAGAEEASYAIRNLISSERLTSEVAMRDPATGKLTTMSNTVEGPVAVFCTTTDPEVDPETKSRFLVTGIDESREQTRRVLRFQKQRQGLEGLRDRSEEEETLRVHRNFQRLLQPIRVVNPHVDRLTYDDDRLQCRRAQPQYLNIINTVAFMNQLKKEVKRCEINGKSVTYIEVDEADIELANRVAVDILGKTLDELSIPARNLLGLITAMVEERLCELRKKEEKSDSLFRTTDVTFTRRQLREHTGWAQTRLHIHLKELVSMEYVLVESGRSNSLQHYRLVYNGQGRNGERFIPGLKLLSEEGESV